MPIEKIYVDAMLGTFRNMLQDCREKKSDGESFEKMEASMNRMETLALEMNDFTAYSTKLSTEGLFTEFSTAYGAVLAEEGQKKYAGNTYNDAQLLEQTLSAYENSLSQLDTNPDKEKLQAPVKAVLKLGRSGINYPTFLRLLIEKGLDKAMEGSVLSRETLEKDLQWAIDLQLPVYIERNKTILAKYDEMAAVAAFAVPDAVAFSMERFKIESAFQPAINQYQAIVDRWQKLLQLLHDWIDAHTSFAAYDARYASAEGMQATLRNIKFYKECNPGFFKVREDIFTRYFSLQWEDIFVHESFRNECKAKRCLYTDAYINFLREIYPVCKPFTIPSPDLISKAERLHKENHVFI
ncbi:MAG: hypothetical protein ABJA78_03400 [Ferruginibacter sp.]